jgi:hypothetical protein
MTFSNRGRFKFVSIAGYRMSWPPRAPPNGSLKEWLEKPICTR